MWPLTHLPLVPHICVSESGQHWFRLWLVAYSAPSHYLNQCCIIVSWIFRNKLQWNFNQNTFFHSQKCIWKYRLKNGSHFVAVYELNKFVVEVGKRYPIMFYAGETRVIMVIRLKHLGVNNNFIHRFMHGQISIVKEYFQLIVYDISIHLEKDWSVLLLYFEGHNELIFLRTETYQSINNQPTMHPTHQ